MVSNILILYGKYKSSQFTEETDFLMSLSLDCYFRLPLEVTTGSKVVSPEANILTPSIIQEKSLKNLPNAPTILGSQRDQDVRHDDGKVIMLKCRLAMHSGINSKGTLKN